MGLFGSNPDRVVSKGSRTSGKVVAIRVSEVSSDDTKHLVHEFVVAVGAGGRRAAVRQNLMPADRIRLGMIVDLFERGDDIVIDWERTMSAQGVDDDTITHGWKMVKDWEGTGIIDTSDGRKKALEKGIEARARIEQFSQRSHLGGLAQSTTIAATVTVPGDEPYSIELGGQVVPDYATHLAQAGTELRCFVDAKRLDRVTLDWADAAERNPGVGVAPVEYAPRREAEQAMATGSLADDGSWIVDAPTDFEPPPPIEGVSWQTYLTVSVELERSKIKPKDWDAHAQRFGVPAGRWGTVSQAWAMAMMRDPQLQQAYAAARQ